MFQSTHPHGVRHILSLRAAQAKQFQSTHPHGVRRVSKTIGSLLHLFQSTHPHGVRHSRVYYDVLISAFQSTHPHGVRPSRRNDRILPNSFNPRTHTGCDNKQKYAVAKFAVSIHAPTRGATYNDFYRFSQWEFQSTHPHGVRHFAYSIFRLCFTCFNPRTHTGCDFPLLRHHTTLVCFNPRTHTGCDKMGGLQKSSDFKFQSTHPHGVRRQH